MPKLLTLGVAIPAIDLTIIAVSLVSKSKGHEHNCSDTLVFWGDSLPTYANKKEV